MPQFQQPHGLLLGGLRALGAVFGPRFEGALLAAGGVPVDWGLECDFRDFGVTFARGPSQLRTVCASRALFEHVCRSFALANARIALRAGCPVTGLVLDEEGAAVTGARECRGQCRGTGRERVRGCGSEASSQPLGSLPGCCPGGGPAACTDNTCPAGHAHALTRLHKYGHPSSR